MSETRLEGVLRRDRAIVLAALSGLAVLAWLYIIWLAAMPAQDVTPGGMEGMAGHDTPAGGMAPAIAAWSSTDFLLMLLMWAAMMVGMMTPSAAPMILLYARVGRQAAEARRPFAPAGWFACGYLLTWTLFSVAATSLQWLLEQAMLLTPMMRAQSPRVGGLLLVVAGLYQWTPLKDSCLAQCQSPFLFVQRHGGFRGDRSGAIALGLRHGLYCIGCCWGLMLLLFVGGVMNLLWIAALAALVLVEKVTPWGRAVARASGLGFAAAGLVLLAGLF